MKVVFKNSEGVEREIGKVKTVEEAHKAIKNFLNDKNYKSYYTRTWESDNGIVVDVGSWSELFYIRKDND